MIKNSRCIRSQFAFTKQTAQTSLKLNKGSYPNIKFKSRNNRNFRLAEGAAVDEFFNQAIVFVELRPPQRCSSVGSHFPFLTPAMMYLLKYFSHTFIYGYYARWILIISELAYFYHSPCGAQRNI